MHLRLFLSSILFTISSLVGSAALVTADDTDQLEDSAPVPPNIIYILADDLGYGDLSGWGQTKFSTPNIDRLMAEGMRFTQHYAGCTVCAPSRSSLLTGQHTGHTPIRGNIEHPVEGQLPIPRETITLAERLREVGYVTAVFGKWGLGYPGSAGDPLQQGFDHFFGYNCQRLAHNYYPYHLWDDTTRVILDENAGSQQGVYAPELIHQKTLEFIRENQHRPFFAYVASPLPHAELLAPERNMTKYRGKFEPERSYQGVEIGGRNYRNGAYSSQPEAYTAFSAMVDLLDEQVGDIIALLHELGIAENTLVIFTSDNGPHREGGADPVFFNSAGPLRGGKRLLYEGGIRVPMAAWWPGTIQAGSTSKHISAFWDVMPTFLELTGGENPQQIDGISFLPTLLGHPGQREHEYLYWEFHEQGGRQAARWGQWKAVLQGINKKANPEMEIYDLSTDIGETTNLASSHPALVARARAIFAEARTENTNAQFNFHPPGS